MTCHLHSLLWQSELTSESDTSVEFKPKEIIMKSRVA